MLEGAMLEVVHQIHLQRLAILRTEIDMDPGPEERSRVLADIRDVHSSALLKGRREQEVPSGTD